jgi:hypothetical protein
LSVPSEHAAHSNRILNQARDGGVVIVADSAASRSSCRSIAAVSLLCARALLAASAWRSNALALLIVLSGCSRIGASSG